MTLGTIFTSIAKSLLQLFNTTTKIGNKIFLDIKFKYEHTNPNNYI